MSRLKFAKAKSLGEQFPVDVREGGQGFIKILLPLVRRHVEHREKLFQVDPQIRAIGLCAVLDEEPKRLAFEDARALREKAEQDPHQEAFEIVAFVSAGLQRVVQAVHDGDRLQIDRVVILEAVLLVAGDEGERMNRAVQIGKCEFGRLDPRPGVVLGLKVVQFKAGKVGNDDIPRHFILASLADQILDIIEGLRFRLAEVLATTFVLDKEHPFPEQIDSSVRAGNLLDRFLERGHRPALHAEDPEEFVPKGLLLGVLACCPGPIGGKTNGVLADLVPGDRHSSGLC